MEPAFQSATSLAADLRERRIGCLELLDHFIARVDRFNPDLNAIVVFDFERARERTRAADAALARGEVWGPLHGLPMTVKDSYDVAGLPTTWGAPELRGNVPEANAVAIDRLLAAGAVIFGKTNVPYNLADLQSYNDVYGTTNNPWDLERVPGGSSAAPRRPLPPGSRGSRRGATSGGSIRNPAHYCGVYGHKPTWGGPPASRPRQARGARADRHLGHRPAGARREDLALAVDVMAGPDRIEANGWKLDLPRPQGREPGDWRVAVWADDPICPVDHAVRDAVLRAADALRAAGARVDYEARPGFDPAEADDVYTGLLQSALSARHGDEEFRKTLDRARAPRRRGHPPRPPPSRRDDAPPGLDPDPRAPHPASLGVARVLRRFRCPPLAPLRAFPPFPTTSSATWTPAGSPSTGRPASTGTSSSGRGSPAWPCFPPPSPPRPSEGLPVGVQIVGPEGGDHTTIEVARHLGGLIGGFRPPPGYE